MAILPIFARSQITRSKKPLGHSPIHGERVKQNSQWPRSAVGVTASVGNPYALRSALDTPVPDGDISNAPRMNVNPNQHFAVKPLEKNHYHVPLAGGAQYRRATTINQPKPWHEALAVAGSTPEAQEGRIHNTGLTARPGPLLQKKFIGWDEGSRKPIFQDTAPPLATPLAPQDTAVHGDYYATANLDGARTPKIVTVPAKATAGSIQQLYMFNGGPQVDNGDVMVTNSSGGPGGRAMKQGFVSPEPLQRPRFGLFGTRWARGSNAKPNFSALHGLDIQPGLL